MFFNEKRLTFSIRKFSVGVASAIVGVALLGSVLPAKTVSANDGLIQNQQLGTKTIQYKYVLESDLTEDEKLRIQEELPNYQVGDYDTYFMVYRPKRDTLPSTGNKGADLLLASAGVSLLVLVFLRHKRQKAMLSTIVILGATSAISVSAISSGLLSHHDKSFTLSVGTTIPETKIAIDQYEFVGYISDAASEQAFNDFSQPIVSVNQANSLSDVDTTLSKSISEALLSEVSYSEVTSASEASTSEITQSEVLSNSEVSTNETPYSEIVSASEVSTSELSPSEAVVISETSPLVTTNHIEVPYETIYQDDATIVVGQENIVQAGQNGLKRLTYHDGQLVSEELTVAPIAQIIRRGTKVAQPETSISTSTVVSGMVSMSTSIATSVVSSTTMVTSTSIVASDSDSLATSELLSESIVASEVTSEVEVPIVVPVESTISTEISVSPSESATAIPLPSEEIVTSEISISQSPETSQSVNDAISTSTSSVSETAELPTLTDPIISNDIEETIEIISSPVIEEIDDNLWEDETQTIEGSDGEKLVTRTYQTIDGVRQPNPVVTETVILEAQPTIIKVGTKPIRGSVSESFERPIAFDVRYEDDPNALIGTSYTKQDGQDGLELVTLTYDTIKGEKDGQPLETVEPLRPAVAQIIVKGTSDIEETIEIISSPVIEEIDNNLWEDETQTIEGSDGEKLVTRTYQTIDGVRQPNPVVTENVILEAQPTIIKVGTKPIRGSVSESFERPIAFDVRYEDDPNALIGTSYTKQDGQDGLELVTLTYDTIKGEKDGQPLETVEPLRSAVAQIIVKGTSDIEETIEIISSPVIEEIDNNLWEDETQTIEGSDGEKLVTRTYQTIDGVHQPNPVVTENVILEAQPTIIKVGTKPIRGSVSESFERPIAFDVRYEDDPNALIGTSYTKQDGQEGLELVTLTYDTIKGEKDGQPLETVETLRSAVPQIIVRGTKEETEADKQSPLVLPNKQVVSVGERPIPELSLQTELLTNVADYSWVTEPVTSSVGSDIPGRIRISYTDNSTDEVDVTIDVIVQKSKPVLTFERLIEHDDDKKVTLNYDLTDPTDAYLSAKIEIVDDKGQVVKTQEMIHFDDFDVTGLGWYTPYTLRTTLTYDIGAGPQTEALEEVPFELEYKKVEIKHIDRVELYQKLANGGYQKVVRLENNPTDLSSYYVKVLDDKRRAIYLSVIDSTQTQVGDQTVYQMRATAPQLIEYIGGDTDNQADYRFYIPKFIPSANGKYTRFDDLIKAITEDPTGTFELADHLDASDFQLADGANSYIPGNFSGSLNGANHSITGLKLPLFHTLKGAFTIRNLDLKEVAIVQPNAIQIGALARYTEGISGQSHITNVAVEGNITGNRLVGGVIYQARNTTFENISFEGNIDTTTSSSTNISGGLVAYLRDSSTINKGKVDAVITVNANENPEQFHIGAVSGAAEVNASLPEGSIRNVSATGHIINKAKATANIGGVVGSTTQPTRIRNVVSSVDVTNGEALIGRAGSPMAIDGTVVQVEGTSSNTTEDVPTISGQDAQDAIDAMAITVTARDTDRRDLNAYDVQYGQVAGYQASHQVIYENLEKLQPFYNKESIVNQGNLLPAGHELATKTLLSVTPMSDQDFVSNYAADREKITKILLYFADGSKTELAVTYLDTFKDTGILEYRIDELGILYTPEQVWNHYTRLVDQILPELDSLDYYDPSILAALGKSGNTTDMDKLYLKESYDQIKNDLTRVLQSVFATSDVIATDRTHLAQYALDNKEALLMGLAYVNRWYDIDFGDVNAKELIMYHQDIFGQSTNTLEWLISIGKTYDSVRMIKHLDTYASTTKAHTGRDSFFDYLSFYRTLFTNMDENTWFKEASEAYIVEAASIANPDAEVRAYHKLLNDAEARKYILPLLTVREGIYYISNMSTINFGMYDRYFDMSLKTTDPERYAQEVEKVEAKVDAMSIRLRDHFDFWYRMSLETVKDRNVKTVPNWDGYYLNREGQNQNKWLPMFGADANDAIRDFFGPLEGSHGSHFGGNGSGAYAMGNLTRFVVSKLLDDASVYTHEMVHNSDGLIYLGGYGRRFGQRAELYAQGLLQAPYHPNTENFGINTIFDYRGTSAETADTRYQALSPDRFQDSSDLEEYFKGMFDVLYTLDQLEAEAILKLSKDEQRRFFNKIENTYVTDAVLGIPTHAGNTIRRLTEEEFLNLNLNSINDLVDNDLVSHRQFSLHDADSRDYNRNGYYDIPLFSSIYSALHNPNGAPGDLMFRRMAFELLAEKGYEDGFLPYVSDQLANQARARGDVGTETWPRNHEVARVTDDFVFKTIFKDEYQDWKAFKKAMFERRAAKMDDLKEISITFNNEEVVLNSPEKIRDLMDMALKEDLKRFLTSYEDTKSQRNNNNYARDSRVKELKAKIYNAYLRLTNDFTDSIYRN